MATNNPVVSTFIANSGELNADLDACDVYGKVRILRVSCTVPTADTDGTTTFVLGKMPPGHSLFLGHLSLINVSPVPDAEDDVTFDLGLGSRQEPLGELLAADLDALVDGADLLASQTLLGTLANAKVRAIGRTEIIMTTSDPLPADTVIEGYLAFAAD